ncbi:hypothetical protein C8P63_12335 [Melghirimyces profundicolus]|uniref:Uncharacterized protein n=1 Tax=Melghirimyces profundicolus TaxID=1242148 RepID=A0A2T6BG23_9BACL|nr:hypothetical protein C8P63_12335 [Melghirimyces profundicolus]
MTAEELHIRKVGNRLYMLQVPANHIRVLVTKVAPRPESYIEKPIPAPLKILPDAEVIQIIMA